MNETESHFLAQAREVRPKLLDAKAHVLQLVEAIRNHPRSKIGDYLPIAEALVKAIGELRKGLEADLPV